MFIFHVYISRLYFIFMFNILNFVLNIFDLLYLMSYIFYLVSILHSGKVVLVFYYHTNYTSSVRDINFLAKSLAHIL